MFDLTCRIVAAAAIVMATGCAEPVQYQPAEPLDDRTMAMWTESCALCHVSGEAGAPRTGVLEEWQPRLEQGQDQLIRHTIEGFNMMPPLGYCMGCETADFARMIEFMAGVRLETGA